MLYQLTPKITVLGKVIVKPDKSFSFLAYLVRGSKNILIDTVPEQAAEVFLEELETCLPLDQLDAVIMNHSESDHSGALGALLARRPEIPIYCSLAGAKRLAQIYPQAHLIPVTDGHTEKIGDLLWHFRHTPGLHWDDNMVTYLNSEKILFSNDLFGQALGSSVPLDKDFTEAEIMQGVKSYFTKVFAQATPQEKAVLAQVTALAPERIAVGHGVILAKHLPAVIDYYQTQCES